MTDKEELARLIASLNEKQLKAAAEVIRAFFEERGKK